MIFSRNLSLLRILQALLGSETAGKCGGHALVVLEEMDLNMFCLRPGGCVKEAAAFCFVSGQKVPICGDHSQEYLSKGYHIHPLPALSFMQSEDDAADYSTRQQEVHRAKGNAVLWKTALNEQLEQELTLIEVRKADYFRILTDLCQTATVSIKKQHAEMMAFLEELEGNINRYIVVKGYQLDKKTRILVTGRSDFPGLRPVLWKAELPLAMTVMKSVLGIQENKGTEEPIIHLDLRIVRLQEVLQRITEKLAVPETSSYSSLFASLSLLSLVYSFLPESSESGHFPYRESVSKLLTVNESIQLSISRAMENASDFLVFADYTDLKRVEFSNKLALMSAEEQLSKKNYGFGRLSLTQLKLIQETCFPGSSPLAKTCFLIGEVLRSENQKKAALSYYEKSLQIRLEVGVDPLETAQSYLYFGRCNKSLGNLTEAEQAYSQAKKILKTDFSMSTELGKVYYYQSVIRIRNGQFESAGKKCAKAILLQGSIAPDSPDLADSYSLQGYILDRLERFSAAEAAFKSAIGILRQQKREESGDLGRVFISFGNVFFHQNLFERAKEEYLQALNVSTGDLRNLATANYWLGLVYISLGKRKEAETSLKAALVSYQESNREEEATAVRQLLNSCVS